MLPISFSSATALDGTKIKGEVLNIYIIAKYCIDIKIELFLN